MTHKFAQDSHVLKSPKKPNNHTTRTPNNWHDPQSLSRTEKRRQNSKIADTESKSTSQQNASKIEISKPQPKRSKRSYTCKQAHA